MYYTQSESMCRRAPHSFRICKNIILCFCSGVTSLAMTQKQCTILDQRPPCFCHLETVSFLDKELVLENIIFLFCKKKTLQKWCLFCWRRQTIYVLILSNLMYGATHFRWLRSNGEQMKTQLLILHSIPTVSDGVPEQHSVVFPIKLESSQGNAPFVWLYRYSKHPSWI